MELSVLLIVASVKLTNVPKVGLRFFSSRVLFSQASSQCCPLTKRYARGRSQSLFLPRVTAAWWSKLMMNSRTWLEESLRQAMTTQGGWRRLSLQTGQRLPRCRTTLSMRWRQRSQLRSYSQYSQAPPERCLERALIQRLRQRQWMCFTEPAHWQRLSSGLRSPSSRPKQTLQNSPSCPSSEHALPIFCSDFSTCSRCGDWCVCRQEPARLILSARSMSDTVRRFSCRSISLNRWQIFLITNSRSARRTTLPSCRARLSPAASARQRVSLAPACLRNTISAAPSSSRRSISNWRSPNLQRVAYRMALVCVWARKEGKASGALAWQAAGLWKSKSRPEGLSTEMETWLLAMRLPISQLVSYYQLKQPIYR